MLLFIDSIMFDRTEPVMGKNTWLPYEISRMLSDGDCRPVTIGMSGDRVWQVGFPDGPGYLKASRGTEIKREAGLLNWLAGRLPVPAIRFFGVLPDPADGIPVHWMLTDGLPGDMLCDSVHLADPEGTVRVLAAALVELRGVDIADCPFDGRLDVQLRLAEEQVCNGSVRTSDWETTNRFASPEALLRYLAANRPEETPLVFTHGDFCLPNLLARDGRLTGFVDWGRGGIGDPWRDIALCVRSIHHNLGTAADRVLPLLYESAGIQPDAERLEYYNLLDELF